MAKKPSKPKPKPMPFGNKPPKGGKPSKGMAYC